MKAAHRNANELRHRAIDAITETEPPRTEVIQSAPTEGAFAANPGSRLAYDAVAFFERANLLAHRRDLTAEFMPHDDRVVHLPGVRRVPLVQIAPANANSPHSQQHLRIADLRLRLLLELYPVRLWLDI